jgi:hypothetical protein
MLFYVSVHVRFVMDNVALRQVFLSVIRVYPVSIIPTWFSILIHHLGGMNNRPAGGRSSETFSHAIDTNSSNTLKSVLGMWTYRLYMSGLIRYIIHYFPTVRSVLCMHF